MKKYREAAADFNEAIQINRLRQIAYIGRGDCERAAENYDTAIKFYNQALKIEANPALLLRKAICNLELQRYDIAMADIDTMLESDPENS